jgi:hypothetical protein
VVRAVVMPVAVLVVMVMMMTVVMVALVMAVVAGRIVRAMARLRDAHPADRDRARHAEQCDCT